MRNIRINTFTNAYPSVHHPNQADQSQWPTAAMSTQK